MLCIIQEDCTVSYYSNVVIMATIFLTLVLFLIYLDQQHKFHSVFVWLSAVLQ